jgi:hypothetical protein
MERMKCGKEKSVTRTTKLLPTKRIARQDCRKARSSKLRLRIFARMRLYSREI